MEAGWQRWWMMVVRQAGLAHPRACPTTHPASSHLRSLAVQVRHGPHMYGCQLEESSDGSGELQVTLDGNDQGLAAGQFAVFYQAGVCLGSAVITGCDAY